MATSDERREVAERLREYSNDVLKDGSLLKTLKDVTGAYSWRDVLDRLADLIDPTCHPVPSDDGRFSCSECGERIGAVLPALGTVLMHHCSHCGARVTSVGELHGITGTEIGKYRYVSDNEDGEEG